MAENEGFGNPEGNEMLKMLKVDNPDDEGNIHSIGGVRVVVNTSNQSKNTPNKENAWETEKREKKGEIEGDVEKSPNKVAYAVSFYVVTSLSIVFFNKLILSHLEHEFEFPITMTFFQICGTLVICMIAYPLNQRIKVFKKVLPLPKLELDWKKMQSVLLYCLVFVGMITFNNFCLLVVDVTLYLVFRSLTILFAVIFQYVILGIKTPRKVVYTIFVVILGYFIGSFGGFQNERYSMNEVVIGGIIGVFSSMFVCLNSILMKGNLNKFENNTWLLLWYVNVVSFVIFAVLVLVIEFRNLLEFEFWFETDFVLSIIASSIFGFLINVAIFFLLKFTTPLTKEITATAKACLQPILGAYIFSDQLNTFTVIGAVVCILGSFLYSYMKRLTSKK